MTTDPLVRVIVHVMLTMPQALPGSHGPWYCAPGFAHVDVPTPNALVQSYERELAPFGTVTDHIGFGTWTVGSGSSDDVAFEEGDHIEVRTRLSTATRIVPPLLHRMRVQLNQRETLAEIVGAHDGTPLENRTRIIVTLPFDGASYARLRTVHRIFGNNGDGGATQTDGPAGVEVASGVRAADAPRILAELRRAGFAFATMPETFITDDAPPCATPSS